MFRRLLALKIISGVLLFTGCASAPKSAPRFTAPSTVPIQKAISAAKTKVDSAKKNLSTLNQELSTDCQRQAAAMVYALTQDLDGVNAELATAEGARDQLQLELTTQVKQANDLARDYDKANATITSLKESRHHYVKLALILMLMLLLESAWIFRKPLLAIAGI